MIPVLRVCYECAWCVEGVRGCIIGVRGCVVGYCDYLYTT